LDRGLLKNKKYRSFASEKNGQWDMKIVWFLFLL